jgi:hypothetical protein
LGLVNSLLLEINVSQASVILGSGDFGQTNGQVVKFALVPQLDSHIEQ